jgi:hypothetical protein
VFTGTVIGIDPIIAVIGIDPIIGKSRAHMSNNSAEADVCRKFKGAAHSWAHSDCRVLACKNKK